MRILIAGGQELLEPGFSSVVCLSAEKLSSIKEGRSDRSLDFALSNKIFVCLLTLFLFYYVGYTLCHIL